MRVYCEKQKTQKSKKINISFILYFVIPTKVGIYNMWIPDQVGDNKTDIILNRVKNQDKEILRSIIRTQNDKLNKKPRLRGVFTN